MLSRTEDQINTNTPTTEQNTNSSTPETTPSLRERADYVVASDGSGDYEKLSEAMRVVKDGDVIALLDGEYTLSGSSTGLVEANHDFPNVTLAGAGSETTITVTPNTKDSLDDSVAVPPLLKEWKMANVAGITISNVTLTVPSTEALLQCNRCTLDGVTLTGKLFANELNLKNATVESFAFVTQGDVKNCDFPGGFGTYDATVENCRMKRLRTLSFYGTVRNCRIGTQAVTTAVEGFDGQSETGKIERCEIRGRIKLEEGESLKKLVGNKLHAGESVDWFINGTGAEQIYGNAFLGGDIRIDNSETSVYDEETEVGNYYSSFDKADENGDGIIDLPRPIPGEAKLTDQYPLASKDVSKYLESG